MSVTSTSGVEDGTYTVYYTSQYTYFGTVACMRNAGREVLQNLGTHTKDLVPAQRPKCARAGHSRLRSRQILRVI